jgi:predicted PurR-regulated permease PerM
MKRVHTNNAEPDGNSIATMGLFVLAIVAVLYVAAPLLIPIAFAGLISLLLSPAVRLMSRWRIPTKIGAMMLVVAMVVAVVAALSNLAGPANQWLNDAPTSIRELQKQVLASREHLENIQELADEVDQLKTTASANKPQAVVVTGPTVVESLVGGLPALATFLGIVIFLSYFLLASGDQLLRRATRCGRTWSDRRCIVTIARQVQSDLSRYLRTVTIINIALGISTATTMYALDVPNPLLWGVMAGLLNFAPYVGALVSATILTLVGLMTFSSLAAALSVPGAFLVLTILEGQLLTPAIVGRRMSLGPTIVFLSVITWGWLWGVAGALMAVPIVTTLKVVCDHVPKLKPVGHFLHHDRPEPAAREEQSPRQASLDFQSES